MLEVHISKHSLFRLEITVGRWRCTYPSIHVETPSRSRSVDWRACVQAFTFLLTKTLSRSRSVVWCVVWCVCGVLCCVLCVCMWLEWSVGCLCTCGVVCGVGVCVLLCCGGACVWCVVKLGTLSLLLSLLPLLFSFRCPFLFLSYLYFSFSLVPSLTLALALVLSLFLLSSLLATKHSGKNRSTNTAANIEAFECDLAQGKCTAVGSLPPLLPSLLPSPPPLLKKKETFITGIFPARNLFCITVFIYSKKSSPGEITVITVLYKFQNNRPVTRQNCN